RRWTEEKFAFSSYLIIGIDMCVEVWLWLFGRQKTKILILPATKRSRHVPNKVK
ncbi:hypothetical protein SK128_000716, partial [Halocaridina rubra]